TEHATRRTFFAKLMRCHTRIINTGSSSTVAKAPVPAELPPVEAAPAPTPESTPQPQIPILTDAIETRGEIQAVDALETPPAADLDHDEEPTEAEATFSAVTIPNPFGDGDIEVEEIDLAEFSNGPAVG